jgi:hypothetical protein
VRHWLDGQFPGHVTGRHGRVEWPPRFPDLTPLDFYLRVRLKAMLYQVKLQTTGYLKERIRDAYAHITPDVVRRERGYATACHINVMVPIKSTFCK